VRRPALLVAYAAISLTFFVNQWHLILRTPGGWPEVAPAPAVLLQLDAAGLSADVLALTNVVVFGVLTWLLLRPLWRQRPALPRDRVDRVDQEPVPATDPSGPWPLARPVRAR
jgi:hypothetical protein